MRPQQRFVQSGLHFCCRSDSSDRSHIPLIYIVEELGSEHSGFLVDETELRNRLQECIYFIKIANTQNETIVGPK